VSVTELSDSVNAEMAKQTEGRRLALSRKYPPSALWLSLLILNFYTVWG